MLITVTATRTSRVCVCVRLYCIHTCTPVYGRRRVLCTRTRCIDDRYQRRVGRTPLPSPGIYSFPFRRNNTVREGFFSRRSNAFQRSRDASQPGSGWVRLGIPNHAANPSSLEIRVRSIERAQVRVICIVTCNKPEHAPSNCSGRIGGGVAWISNPFDPRVAVMVSVTFRQERI